MRYLYIKTKKLFKKFITTEIQNINYKNILTNRNLPNYIRQHAIEILQKTDREVKNYTIRNRCYITNKSRSVNNLTKLSRIKLKTLISNGYMNSIKKSSW
jgi:small subunit ribosomal protein S14